MNFDTMTRRARRGIIWRLWLKLGLTLGLTLTVLAWFVFPDAPFWSRAAQVVTATSKFARDNAIRALGGQPGGERAQLVGDVELNRIKAAGGYPASEVRCLAVALYFEAGRESRDVQLGVGQIVLNRARERKAPRELCRVVYNGMPNACLFEATCRNLGVAPALGPALASAIEAGRALATGEKAPGRLAGATHFHERGTRPAWSRDLFRLGTFGRLEFYSTEQPQDLVSPPAEETSEPEAPKPAPQRRITRQDSPKAGGTSTSSGSLGRQVFGID